jgi:hypothetical protein
MMVRVNAINLAGILSFDFFLSFPRRLDNMELGSLHGLASASPGEGAHRIICPGSEADGINNP